MHSCIDDVKINEGDLRSFFYCGSENFLKDEAARLAVILRTIRNVIGYIHGADDPDRYVILGNHFDAWVYGSIDPNSGTAVLAEVARAITQTINETNWRPGILFFWCVNPITTVIEWLMHMHVSFETFNV